MVSNSTSEADGINSTNPSVKEVVSSNCKPATAVPSQALLLESTDRIRSLLKNVLTCQSLREDQRADVQKFLRGAEGVPYLLVRDICHVVRREQGGEGPWLHHVLRGSGVWLPVPKPREKCPELKARLAALQDAVDRSEYAELVADITVAERKEKGREFMGTYSEQFGFGLHVLVVMFTLYCFGHYIMMAQFPHQPFMHAVGGVIGLIVGLLVESFLFIIRSVRHDEIEDKNKRLTSNSMSQTTCGAAPSPPHVKIRMEQKSNRGENATASGDSSATLCVNSEVPSSLADRELETAQRERGGAGVREDEALSEMSNDFEISLRRSGLGIRKRIVV